MGKIRAEKFDNDQIVTLWNELLKNCINSSYMLQIHPLYNISFCFF